MPEITDFGACAVCGCEAVQSSYREYDWWAGAMGSRVGRWLDVKCGRCGFSWRLPLQDRFNGDKVAVMAEEAAWRAAHKGPPVPKK